jgi:adenylyl cyclase-associated protein
MKTHKNPNLRSSGPVPAKNKSASPKPVSSAKAAAPVKPPKLELEGRKWAVEYHKNNPNLTIEGTETNQSVYVYKCEGSTLKIEGKVNNIVVDGCKKTAVVFDNAVGSCEFINCQSVQMQVLPDNFYFSFWNYIVISFFRYRFLAKSQPFPLTKLMVVKCS